MRRALAIAAAMLLAGTLLSACGTSEYCQAVQAQQAHLERIGFVRTNQRFAADAALLHRLAKVAPDSVRNNYAKIADATDDLLAAYKAQGVTIEATQKNPKILSTAQRAAINKANTTWNGILIARRTAIATSIKQECEITLK